MVRVYRSKDPPAEYPTIKVMTLSLKNSWAFASGGWLKDRTVKRVANMRTPDGLRIITSCSVLALNFQNKLSVGQPSYPRKQVSRRFDFPGFRVAPSRTLIRGCPE